jgi:hypothetical protein
MEETESTESTPWSAQWSGEFQEVSETTWYIPVVEILLLAFALALAFWLWRRKGTP